MKAVAKIPIHRVLKQDKIFVEEMSKNGLVKLNG